MARKEIEKLMRGAVRDLPLLPQTVNALMDLETSGEDYYEGVLRVAESDPCFAARIMAIANSVAVGGREDVETLPQAMGRVGSSEAANLVLSQPVTRIFIPRNDWEKGLWRHAIRVAVAARELARLAREPDVHPEAAYACGLLHNLGRLIMLQEEPEMVREIELGEADDVEKLENRICGLTHPELGAVVCEQWGIPSAIVEAIRDQRDAIEPHPQGASEKLTSIITAADSIMAPSEAADEPSLEDATLLQLREVASEQLPSFIDLSVPELRDLLTRIFRDASEINSSLAFE